MGRDDKPMRDGEMVPEITNNSKDIEFLDEKVFQYNFSKIGKYEYQDIAFCIRDPQANIIGGISGHTGLGWLYIHGLWIAEKFRGEGYGIRLLEAAEKEAFDRGCHSAYLYSYDFQAPSFYEKAGYRRVATLPDFPTGHQKVYLTKRLQNDV
ncbi:MAG: GNAT family N-acetyltransferase [Desulfobacteraceae bacterium]|nr:GNAT family N-acetyltransferase [Desulfobacteraceae bacterium]